MYQISFYVPKVHLEIVKNAMFKAGAGRLGDYENCAWQTLGDGQFKPIKKANPTIGRLDRLEIVAEYKVEMLCLKNHLKSVIKAMKTTHPYEEVAYTVIKIKQV